MGNIANLDTTTLDTAAKFFRIMLKAGADFSGPMQSTEQRSNLVKYLKMGCPEIPDAHDKSSMESVRSNLGGDFITPEEIEGNFPLTYSDGQLKHLVNTLPHPLDVAWCNANGYFLIPGPPKPMDFLSVCDLSPSLFRFAEDGSFAKDESVGSETVEESNWIVISREPVLRGSLNMVLEEQYLLLRQNQVVPNAATLAWAVAVCETVRNVHLLSKFGVRTSTTILGDWRICLGGFGTRAPNVDYCPNKRPHHLLGLAVLRKF